jgi:hypothetical protein
VRTPHLLLAAPNLRRLQANIVHIVDAKAMAALDAEICSNVADLYRLGRQHYLFAMRQNNAAWRQKISRLYYGAYNGSRAIRLCVQGDYSTDATDHKKIGDLPDNFPNRETYKNRLNTLRDDRNLCDYDHTARSGDLSIGVKDSILLVTDFLSDAHGLLKQRGVFT